MKILITSLVIGCFVLFTPLAQADAPVRPPQSLESLISTYSRQYGVSEHLMTYIVQAESTGSTTIIGDMNIKCPYTGKPVRSKGLVQISDCYHPEVTDEQAFDAEFSIAFLARNLHLGNCHEWTTCKGMDNVLY